MQQNETFDSQLDFQRDRQKAAAEFIKIVNDLWFDNSIELVLFRNQLIDRNVSQVLNLIEYAVEFVEKPISIFEATEMARTIRDLHFSFAKLDIGKLVFEFHMSTHEIVADFISDKIPDLGSDKEGEPKDVVLYGFGRIGRLVARELISKTGKGQQLRLRAIVTRGEINQDILEKRASLLRFDSVHGDFSGSVRVDVAKKALILDGTVVHVISANNPEDIDYTKYDIKDALIIDNTGAFRDKEALNRHLKAKGASKVLLTAPGKGIPNIVHGVNHNLYSPDQIDIFSAASCTTNAITPILKVIEDNFGVDQGHLETIHAYTNDQNLVDNMHKKYRRGRAAALNMVITETGAGKAVSKVLPSLEGKLTSNAIRVPVPNGSLAILNLRFNKATTQDELNATFKLNALEGDLIEQIKFSLSNELVSSDIVGCSAPAIYDSKATIVAPDGKSAVLYIWYDNEYGYSHQVIRLAKYVSKVRRFTYY